MLYLTILLWSLWFFASWACIYLLLLARERSHPNKLPPGPTPLPIVGSLFQLGSKPNESLAELAKKYGPLMSLRLGGVLTVVASSVKTAKEVLQKNDQALSGRTVADAVRALHYHESTMAWSPATAYWRRLRMLCNTHMFTAQRLDASQGLRQQKVQQLIAYMHKNSQLGRAVNIGQAAFVTTLNLLSNAVFSMDLVDLNSDSAQEFKDTVHGIMEDAGRPNLSDYFPLLRPIDLQGIRRRMAAHFKKLYAIFDKLIDKRMIHRESSNYSPRNDYLDLLLDQRDDKDFKIGRQDIRALITEIFAAGSDTSSSTIEWAMAELICNPKAMARARKEVMETIGIGQEVKESDTAQLPYLQAVVKETLRLHPAVPLLVPHRAETSVSICGYNVPKHAQVLVNIWAIGRDPDLWVNPTSFQPERFLGSNIDLRGRDFGLIPFGAGRRICPGLPLALRMVHLMLASLVHCFAWKLPEGVAQEDINMSDKFGITLQMAVPLLAVPVQE